MKNFLYNACFSAFVLLGTLVTLPAVSAPGQLDTGFNAGGSSSVTCTAVQPDGKILIGGGFTTVGGATRNRIARLNADGSLDLGFNPDANGTVLCMVVQSEGNIVIGGGFTVVGGATRNHIARLSADGSLDLSFNPDANGTVICMMVQTDREIVISGTFTTVGGVARDNIARLDEDGALDYSFNPPNVDISVDCLALQADGKILIGGFFFTVGGMERNNVARLNADGTLDLDFEPFVHDLIHCMAVQTDGKIVIGDLNRVARFNADGTQDFAFSPFVNSSVYCEAVQADGKIVLGGLFTAVDGVARNGIARLNADGTLDSGFNPNANSSVSTMALQADGKIVIGVNSIARLLNDVATQSLRPSSESRVEWLRGGTSPEAQGVGFEFSTDRGTNWAALGAGTRIVGGWEETGLSLPPSGLLRARARVIGGRYDGSASLVETVAAFPFNAAPAVANSIADFSVNYGTANTLIDVRAVFEDAETADADLVYSVRANNNPSLVSATIDNTTDTLALEYQTNVIGAAKITVRATDEVGLYAENTFLVTVRLVAPSITAQPTPTNVFLAVGSNYTISVSASGSMPLTYRWRKGPPDNLTITNMSLFSTNCSFTLTNVQPFTNGNYRVGVFNSAGGSPLSAAVFITAQIPPAITNQPTSQAAEVGSSATFTVGATGSSLSYQWRLNGSLLPDATNSSLTLTNVQPGQSGDYTVAVTNHVGAVVSLPAGLTVGPTPFQLTGLSLSGGSAFQFRFTYQSGLPFIALATTNLMLPSSNWTILGPVTESPPGQYQFTDPAVTNYPWRFFRVRSP